MTAFNDLSLPVCGAACHAIYSSYCYLINVLIWQVV